MKSCPQCSATYPDEYRVCPKDGSELSEDILWKPNSIIRGKYKILAKLGEGGMATVYRAHHQLLDEPHALKVIKSELARDPQFVERFKQEAILTRKLQHLNAVRVDDLDMAEDGRPFMAMELVEGENLRAVIQRGGPLPIERVVDISLQICQALDAAHSLGMIHRDIKPDNIVLVPRLGATPLVKILDFGIARLKEGAPGALRAGMTLTGTGVVVGTPEYMSPEQAMGKPGEALDGRSDLYSLGIVMYRMLTGELPFKADTTVEMLLHHIQTVPKAPKTLKPELGIPDAISAIVMKALEKDRDRRFPTAAAMAAAIRETQALTSVLPQPAKFEAKAPPLTAALAPSALKRAEGVRSPSPLAPRGPSQVPPSARPMPPKPAGLRPAPAAAAEKKRFPARAMIVGVTAVVVVALAMAFLGRRRAPNEEKAPAPASPPAQPTSLPSPESTTSSGKPSGEPASHKAKPAPEPETPSQTSPPPAPAAAAVSASPSASSLPTESSAEPTSVESNPPAGPAQGPGQGPEPHPSQPKIEGALQKAQGFFDSGDYARAAKISRRILQVAPQNRPAFQMLARSLQKQGQQFYQAGQYGRAASMFRQIVEIAPNNPNAQRMLERCMQAMRAQRERQ